MPSSACRSLIAGLSALAVLGTGTAACGGDGSGGSKTGPSAPPGRTTEAPESAALAPSAAPPPVVDSDRFPYVLQGPTSVRRKAELNTGDFWGVDFRTNRRFPPRGATKKGRYVIRLSELDGTLLAQNSVESRMIDRVSQTCYETTLSVRSNALIETPIGTKVRIQLVLVRDPRTGAGRAISPAQVRTVQESIVGDGDRSYGRALVRLGCGVSPDAPDR